MTERLTDTDTHNGKNIHCESDMACNPFSPSLCQKRSKSVSCSVVFDPLKPHRL